MSDTLEDIDTSQLDNVERVKVDTPSNVTILDMTEDCTRLVFDRLTLNQLIHLRAVCHAWNDIITDICEKKSKLQLFFSANSIRHYLFQTYVLNVQDHPQFELNERNLLSISITKLISSAEALKLTRDASFSEQPNGPNLGIRFIARLFPNITNFVCEIQHDRMFELPYILWRWSTNLNTLTLYLNSYTHMCQDALKYFDKCFEQLISLRRFHLLGKRDELVIQNARTFGQLEEFTFDCYPLAFVQYFAQLDANRCKILRVGGHLESLFSEIPNPLLNLAADNPEVVSKLTHLSISFYAQRNHISNHCAKFLNLIHLEIDDIYNLSMANVLQQIVPLQKLKTLTLNLCNLSICQMEHYSTLKSNYRNAFPIFHNTITELRLMDKADKSYFPEFEEYKLLAKIFPIVMKIHIYSNNLNKATFDEQFRSRFSEAFGERVEVTFFQSNKFCIDDFY